MSRIEPMFAPKRRPRTPKAASFTSGDLHDAADRLAEAERRLAFVESEHAAHGGLRESVAAARIALRIERDVVAALVFGVGQ